jgi:nucleotide-binding universal stress UspA family protein
VQELRNQNLMASSEPRTGPPVGELLAVIRLGDVVVLAMPDRGPLERWLLGSVSKELIQRAAGPVLLVRGAQVPAAIREGEP